MHRIWGRKKKEEAGWRTWRPEAEAGPGRGGAAVVEAGGGGEASDPEAASEAVARKPDPGAAARRTWSPVAEAGAGPSRGIPRLRRRRIFGFGRIRTRRAAEAEGGRAAVGASALQRVEAEG